VTGRKRRTAQYRRMARTKRQLADPTARGSLARELKAGYEAGASIRDLATRHTLAFGTVRSLLLEAGAVLRGPGGPNHGRSDRDTPGS
jgi:hypothetical protein